MTINCINNTTSIFDFGDILIQGNAVTSSTGDLIIATDGSNDIQFRNNSDLLLNMTFDGNLTLPKQPAFLVYKSSDSTNQTGAGAQITINFDATEVFDQGSNFTSGTTFTAPVTGMYHFSMLVSFSNLTSSMDVGKLRLVTSNRTYIYELDAFNSVSNASSGGIVGSVIADMDAADTASVTLTIEDGAGNTATISGSSSEMITYFSGYLVA
jgi:hypothetical protein